MNDEWVGGWVELGGFPGYSIHPTGRVRHDESARHLTTRINQYGVPYVGMMRNDKQIVRSLPRLVAQTFLPSDNPIFDTVILKDGDSRNCDVSNLVWRPRWYAVRYGQQFHERYPHPIQVPVRAVDEPEVFPDSFAAACYYGLLEKEVVHSVLNRTPTWPTYQEFELAQSL